MRAIASIEAPPSVHVEWVWQSPRSRSRYDGALGRQVDDGLRLELGQVGRHLTGQRLGDDLRRRVADAVEVGERAVGRPFGQLSSVGLPDHLQGAHERP